MSRYCSKINPARFDKRATFQSVTQTTDSQGGYTDAWTFGFTCWAMIEPVKGYEKMQAMQTEAPVTHKVTMRYRSGVVPKMRMTYGGRTFDVKEVINVGEQSHYLQLKVLERA